MAGALAGPSRGPLQSADSITGLLTALQSITAVSRFTALSATPVYSALQRPVYSVSTPLQHYRAPLTAL